MNTLTFQVLEGVDRGRIFPNLETPVTIGREEGNRLRLNDERVSRFHAKIQIDNEDTILTDLESTNGTRVNGRVVQIRRLRPGDRVCVGRTILLFGSNEQIIARRAALANQAKSQRDDAVVDSPLVALPPTLEANTNFSPFESDLDFDLNVKDEVTVTPTGLFVRNLPLPPLPEKMSPSQAARVSEILDLMHRGLTRATETIDANEEGTQITLGFADWQKILGVQMLLARYLRAVTEPEALNQ
jgi:pSer/pThr/pTyr-binding forkhead associated (FHA) protein